MTPKRSAQKAAFISRSETLGTDYHVFVEPPEEQGPLPVLVFLDGDYLFDFAHRSYLELRSANAVPPALIVGIGYGRSFGEPGNRRGRDYTPSASVEEPESGGADAFLGHLTGTLWEELERRYPLKQQARYVGGHSLGGLFALHAFFQEQPFFNGALIGAPSVWWNQRHFLRELNKLHARKSSLPGKLFLGIGDQDTDSMLEDFGLLEGQLNKRPFRSLELESRRFPKHNHYDLAPELLKAGLGWLLNH